jgi:hypothetical protein
MHTCTYDQDLSANSEPGGWPDSSPGVLTAREGAKVTLCLEAGRVQEPIWTLRSTERILFLPGNKSQFLDGPVCILLKLPTEFSQLGRI